MHTDAQVRKQGGRLSREDQRRLGDILQRVYDDVVSQGVPDRFRDLLNELNGPRAEEAGEAGHPGGRIGGAEPPEPDRLLGATSDHNPNDKGSS
jgi:hypothetical protein